MPTYKTQPNRTCAGCLGENDIKLCKALPSCLDENNVEIIFVSELPDQAVSPSQE